MVESGAELEKTCTDWDRKNRSRDGGREVPVEATGQGREVGSEEAGHAANTLSRERARKEQPARNKNATGVNQVAVGTDRVTIQVSFGRAEGLRCPFEQLEGQFWLLPGEASGNRDVLPHQRPHRYHRVKQVDLHIRLRIDDSADQGRQIGAAELLLEKADGYVPPRRDQSHHLGPRAEGQTLTM